MNNLHDARPASEHILSHNEQESLAVGHQIAREFSTGGLVLLSGELGTGKSVLARGIGQALNVSGWRGSPTFTIINEYSTSPPLYHLDLYRLSEYEVEDLGLDEIVGDDALVVVEWPERGGRFFDSLAAVPRLQVNIEEGETEGLRIIRFSRSGPRSGPQ